MISSVPVLELMSIGAIIVIVTKDDVPVQVAIKNAMGYWATIGTAKKWSSEGLFKVTIDENLKIHLLKRV